MSLVDPVDVTTVPIRPPVAPTGSRPPVEDETNGHPAKDGTSAREEHAAVPGLPFPSSFTDPAARRRARNALVERHLDFVDRYVRRYSGRGTPAEDLRQTALLALVQAADRFDPDRNIEFRTFAGSTIDGSLKRHFRDRTWAVRPPRALQELHLRIRRADEDLTQRLGRRPTIDEIAREMDVDVDHVHQGLEAGAARASVSIDAPVSTSGASSADHPCLGRLDASFATTEARLVIGPVLAGLDEPSRELLRMRFVDGLSQEQISQEIGVSQSYVSRLLRSLLADVRELAGVELG
jgi:RNA polymerase sigma-B factor